MFLERGGDGFLIERLVFDQKDGDPAVDDGTGDVVHFFQGCTSLVILDRSCRSLRLQDVGGLGKGHLGLGESAELHAFGAECCFDLGFVERLALFHQNRGAEPGDEDGLDAILCCEGRTDPIGSSSSAPFAGDDGEGDRFFGGGLGGDLIGRSLVRSDRWEGAERGREDQTA